MNGTSSKPPDKRTSYATSLILRLARRTVPGPVGEDFATELESEFLDRACQGGIAKARIWLVGQVFSLNVLRLRRGVVERRRDSRHASLRRRSISGGWLQDLHNSLRTIRHAPGYALTVITTFALAAGANVAVFSVVNGVLLQPLPYPEPSELVTVNRVLTDSTVLTGGISHPDYLDWTRDATTLQHAATYARARETYFGGDYAEEWFGLEVSPSLFSLLGVRPDIGRTLLEGVDPPLNGDGLVLSHALWRSRFASDSGIVGRSVRFEDRTMTIVGVMPSHFYFPTREEQYWTTLGSSSWIQMRGSSGLYMIARLAPDATLRQVQREMSGLAAWTDNLPDAMDVAAGVRITSYHESYVGHTRRLFRLLSAAVAVVLVIACANITNLGLTRASVRRKEFAIRAAVGAGPWRITRLLLTESVTLAALGAVAAVGVAVGIVQALGNLIPADLPRSQDIRVDATVLAFATAIAALSGIVFGLAPALEAWRHSHHSSLQSRTRGTVADRHRTVKWLVISQIGLAQVLIIVAALLLNSFARLSATRPGFDTDHTLTMRMVLPRDHYESTEQVVAFHQSVVEQMRSLPGVVTAGLTSALPFSPSDLRIAYWLEEAESYELTSTSFNGHAEVITADYLEAMGIPMRAGRGFRDGDGPNLVLINQAMVEQHWPNEDPIGKQLRIPGNGARGQRHRVTVLGVVGSVRKRELSDPVTPVIYLSLENQTADLQYTTGRHGYLAIRTTGPPEDLTATAPRVVVSLDHDVVVTHVQSTRHLVAYSIAQPRFRALLIGSFAAIALLVALVGVYGVMSFVVTQRRNELGLRMALGAGASTVMRQVLGRGIVLILSGIAGGTVVALGVSRLLSDFLFEVNSADPMTFTTVSVLLATIGAMACYVPARRASRVDPMTAIQR